MKQQLLYPLVFYVFYIWGLALLNFRTRLKAIRSGEVSYKHFKSFSEGVVTERVAIVGRHYDNQFQLPLLFFLGALAHLAMDHVNTFTLILAWAFIGTRMVHSYIHLGANNVRKRAIAFAAGWLATILFWGQLLFAI